MEKTTSVSYIELQNTLIQKLPQKTIQEIVEVAQDAFGASMQEQEVLEHVLPMERLYLAFQKNRVVGFATIETSPTSLYLAGAAIFGSAQRSGIYNGFTRRRINHALNAEFHTLELRTQNPRIECGVRTVLDDFKEKGIICNYDVQREHQKGIYGRMLTKAKPLSNIPEIDQLYDVLNYDVGDAFFFKFSLT